MKRWMMGATAATADDLELQEVPVPEPGAGQVRVRVAAVSLNARDQMVLAGPFGRIEGVGVVPMSDLAGTVDAVGEGVGGWQIGDRVTRVHVPSWPDGRPVPFGPGPGSLDEDGAAAEHIIVPAESLVPSPANLTDAEAATLQVAGVTAWNSLFGRSPVVAGDRVLVIGSGGVSLFALQLAAAAGAEVYVALRSDHEDPRWQELGVAGIFDTRQEGWGAALFEQTGGVDKVVNTVGAGITNECLAALRAGGEVAVPGLYDMTPPALDTLTLIGKQASIRGVAVGSAEMHRQLSAFVAQHDIHPVIDRRVPFDHLPDAFTGHRTNPVFGKVVIDL